MLVVSIDSRAPHSARVLYYVLEIPVVLLLEIWRPIKKIPAVAENGDSSPPPACRRSLSGTHFAQGQGSCATGGPPPAACGVGVRPQGSGKRSCCAASLCLCPRPRRGEAFGSSSAPRQRQSCAPVWGGPPLRPSWRPGHQGCPLRPRRSFRLRCLRWTLCFAVDGGCRYRAAGAGLLPRPTGTALLPGLPPYALRAGRSGCGSTSTAVPDTQRFILLDTKTGYRSQYHAVSGIVDL